MRKDITVSFSDGARRGEFTNIGLYSYLKANFEGIENLKLKGDIYFGGDVKLPSKVDWSEISSIGGYIPQGCDLSKNEGIILKDIFGVEENVKLPKKVQVMFGAN